MRRGSILRARAAGGALSLLAMALVVSPLASLAQETPGGGPYRLSLGEAARLAAERNAAVLQAQSRVEAADARVRQSTSALLPSVNANVLRGAHTLNTASFGLDFSIPGVPPLFDPAGEVVGPVHGADIRASAEMTLFDLSAFSRRKGAQAGADAARQEARAVEEGAAGAGARAYVMDLRARAEVDAREQDLELANELLEIAQGQVDAGVGVTLDVTRAEAQLATVKAQLLAARHRAEVADLALRRALQLAPDAQVELTSTLEEAAAQAPDATQAVAQAMDARDDLAAAQAYREAATQSLSAVRAGRLPRLSLAGDEGYYGKGFDHMLNTYSWGIRLSMPLFDGFKRSSQVQEERARIHEMDYRIEDMKAEVSFQVKQALLNLSSAQEQASAAEDRLRLAQLEVDQEEERVKAGVSGTADVVRAAMRLNEARTARLDVLAALQAARVALAAAMGTVTELP